MKTEEEIEEKANFSHVFYFDMMIPLVLWYSGSYKNVGQIFLYFFFVFGSFYVNRKCQVARWWILILLQKLSRLSGAGYHMMLFGELGKYLINE